MDGINLILRIVTWALIPTSALLLWSQLERLQPRRGAARHRRRCRGHGARRARAAHERRVRGRRGHPRPPQGARAGAPGGRRTRARRRRLPRQDRHAHRGRDRLRRDRAARRHRRHARARRARRRREPQRDARRAGRGVPAARRLDAHRRGAVLLGPQVERGELRRTRLVGDGRAGDGARRRVAPGPPARRRARGRRPARARARLTPTRRSTASRCRRACSRRRW